MAVYAPEPDTSGGRRQILLAVALLIASFSTVYMTEAAQQRIAVTLRGSVLRPFIAAQGALTGARARAVEIDRLQAELDSLTMRTATLAALVDENDTLRELLGLAERAGPDFLPVTVLRPGTPGSESMFYVDVGSEHGVRAGAPVVSARGLIGRITEVRPRTAVGMDWTHPDFRASAMLMDGTMYGIVENVRGAFREEDRLLLNGTAYHEAVPVGARVLTSGLGVFPRGIPIGTIEGTADVQGTWLKSYWLRPMVQPGSVTHVLVEARDAPADLSELWPADTLPPPPDSTGGGATPLPEREP